MYWTILEYRETQKKVIISTEMLKLSQWLSDNAENYKLDEDVYHDKYIELQEYYESKAMFEFSVKNIYMDGLYILSEEMLKDQITDYAKFIDV